MRTFVEAKQGGTHLLWSAVRHAAKQVDSGLLGLPRAVLDALEERGHDKLDTLPAKLAHDCLGRRLACLTHAVVAI